MTGVIFDQLWRFIALVLLQVLVLDHLDMANGYVVPYLYVLFLLRLPFSVPEWAQLLIGFATGLVMDLFSGTPGMHTSACVVMCYARPLLLRMLAPRGGYEFGRTPTLHDMGSAWFITHAGVLILIHHLWLFFAEAYRFDEFFSTFLRALLSTAFTLILCLLAQYLAVRPARGRT
jgi:hypothetical protein